MWSVFSMQDAAEFVYKKLNHTAEPSVEEMTRQYNTTVPSPASAPGPAPDTFSQSPGAPAFG